ncbi:MAG: hypothetical protein IT374_04290 [Polyangiaceae bacterium]|nr:hypothetical protein [Polyangiaceae bacterium]
MSRGTTLAALTALYAAQGVPFGLAAEYLPVILRQAGYTRVQIAALFWLQLPWQLKPLWAWIGDHPAVMPRARVWLLCLQVALALTLAGYALFDPARGLTPWFALTAAAALLAATQDVFVDAFAVRALAEGDRGLGNSAQIAGYRVGIILGGGGMLLLAGELGAGRTALAAAALVLLTAGAAFALRARASVEPEPVVAATHASRVSAIWSLARVALGRRAIAVALLAATYKLGVHAASTLVKPMLVDAGWTAKSIGTVVVTVGTASAIAGSVLGGLAHRYLGEARALAAGAALQALTIVPLALAERAGLPYEPTAVAIAVEHAASGLGTTVLFAALMTATHPGHAAMHYTALTSLNALAIGLGGLLGARLGDTWGVEPALVAAAVLSLGPLLLLPSWSEHAAASRRGAPA